LASITLVAAGAGARTDVVRRRMLLNWGAWIERRFGRSVFQAAMRPDSRGRAGAPSKALRDLGTLRTFVSSSGAIAWIDLVWAPVFLIVVTLVHPYLGATLAIAISALLILGVLNERMTREPRDAASRAKESESAWVATAENNAETINSLSMANNLADRWENEAIARHDEGHRSRAFSISMQAAMRFGRSCLRIGGIAVGVWLVIQNELTIGAVIAASILSRSSYSMTEKAMLKWRDLKSALVAYVRLKTTLLQVVGDAPSIEAGQRQRALRLDDMGHRYSDQRESVFGRIDLTIAPGQVIAVVGRSATGKTTFSRLASGALKPRFGRVRLGDVDMTRVHVTQTDDGARALGYLPQESVIFPGTVRENVAGMATGDYDLVVDAARLANVHDKILSLPKGYDTDIDEAGRLLSGSERKAIGLARAFYGSPDVIVLDEPEANLDLRARRALGRSFKALAERGSIVIYTSLSKVTARTADKVLLIRAGKIRVVSNAEAIALLGRTKPVKNKKSGVVKKITHG
ncbi:MAG: ATP-binding cassette domain-containing protein, partial [Parvularculaceae bacterium]